MYVAVKLFMALHTSKQVIIMETNELCLSKYIYQSNCLKNLQEYSTAHGFNKLMTTYATALLNWFSAPG